MNLRRPELGSQMKPLNTTQSYSQAPLTLKSIWEQHKGYIWDLVVPWGHLLLLLQEAPAREEAALNRGLLGFCLLPTWQHLIMPLSQQFCCSASPVCSARRPGPGSLNLLSHIERALLFDTRVSGCVTSFAGFRTSPFLFTQEFSLCRLGYGLTQYVCRWQKVRTDTYLAVIMGWLQGWVGSG